MCSIWTTAEANGTEPKSKCDENGRPPGNKPGSGMVFALGGGIGYSGAQRCFHGEHEVGWRRTRAETREDKIWLLKMR